MIHAIRLALQVIGGVTVVAFLILLVVFWTTGADEAGTVNDFDPPGPRA